MNREHLTPVRENKDTLSRKFAVFAQGLQAFDVLGAYRLRKQAEKLRKQAATITPKNSAERITILDQEL